MHQDGEMETYEPSKMETALRIEYRGATSQELWIKAYRLHAGRTRTRLLLLFPLLAFTLALIWHPAPSLLLLVAPGLGFLVAAAFWLLFERQLRTIYRDTPPIREPVNATITEEGIEFVRPFASGKAPWSRFVKMKEGGDILLLYQGAEPVQHCLAGFFRFARIVAARPGSDPGSSPRTRLAARPALSSGVAVGIRMDLCARHSN
jgi:hypothetical protein